MTAEKRTLAGGNFTGAHKSLYLQILNELPYPFEVFTPEGVAVFVNKALMELNGIKDANLIVGRYNLLTDPMCNDTMGYRDFIQRAFGGEEVCIEDFSPPVQELINRGVITEKPYESACMEARLCPIKDNGKLTFVLCFFYVKTIYRGNAKTARVKEYLSRNWRGNFNKKEMVRVIGMSASHIYKLFDQHESTSPGKFHLECKIEHIKEQLRDKNLTVKAAFKACGENSCGWMAKAFKEVTGLSPKEWRTKEQGTVANIVGASKEQRTEKLHSATC